MQHNSTAEAVEQLVQAYGKLVFHTIYGMTGDWEESQDLTQDTFHQALKSLDDARAKSGTNFHAKAWLLQIAVNTVRMQQRRNRLFRFVPFSHFEREDNARSSSGRARAPNISAEALDEQASPVQPPGYSANAAEDPQDLVAERDAVQRTLQQISKPLRECLLLSIVGQFSTAEIASILDIEEAAVRQRITRARKQFQSIYAQVGGEEVSDSTSLAPRSSPSSKNPGTFMSQNATDTHLSHTERAESHRLHSLP